MSFKQKTMRPDEPITPKFVQTEKKEKFRSIHIYKFTDSMDIFLMIIGTFGAFASGACFPLLLFVYQQVTDALVNYGKIKYIDQHQLQNLSQLSCENGGFAVPNDTQTPIEAINDVVRWYVLLGFLSILFYTIGFASFMISAERQIRRIRFKLFRHLMFQDMSYYDQLGSKGRLTSTLSDDLVKMKDGIGDKVADFLSLLARMIGCLIFALVTGWKLTLVILSIAPLVIIAFNLTIKFTVKYSKEQMQAYSKANAIAHEVFSAIRTVTAFNGQKKEYERYRQSLADLPSIGMKKGVVQGLCQIFSNLSQGLVFMGALWYGQTLIKTECLTYSAGKLVVIFIACLNTTWCLNQIVPSLEKFADATAAGSFIFKLLSEKSKIDASKDEGVKFDRFEGDIRFENVSFTYPTRSKQPILHNVNLTIPFGKTVAFVGHSGCGKSTALSLIDRLYNPNEGQILFRNQKIDELNLRWYRSHIGYVGQEPVLFSGSIEENIRLGKPDATPEEIHQAAKMANIHDFIMSLPDQYQSLTRTMLAGGQKQRIAIARALISQPKILLLDEATSALDNLSEQVVKNSLNQTRKDRTTIIIAHRLTTIRDADLIVVFDQGKIVEQGTHEELMEISQGIYQKLAQNDQQEDEEDEQIQIDLPEVKRQISTIENPQVQRFNSIDAIKKRRFFAHRPFLMKLFEMNSAEKCYLFFGCLCSFLFGSVEPAVAFLYSMIYGLLALPQEEDQSIETRNYSLIIFSIYIFAGLIQSLTTISFTKSSENLISRMRLLTFETILKRQISWFDYEENNVSTLLTRLSADTNAFRIVTSIRLNVFCSSFGTILFALIVAFLSGWKLTFVVVCFTPLLILSGYLQGQTQSKAGQTKTIKSFAEHAAKWALESIENIRTVVTLNQEENFISKYEHFFNEHLKRKFRQIPMQAVGKAIANSFLYFIHVSTFSYGASLVEKGEMTFDQVFRVFIVINFASMSIGRSTSAMPDYKNAKRSVQRLLKLIKEKSTIDPSDTTGITLDRVRGEIEYRDVNFVYPTRPGRRVLNHFNLKCQPGQTTAFVGPSGCGKSTTVSLLLRFYDAIHGEVLLDNHDIKTLNVEWLRSCFGYVQQEPILFNLSIRENIAYGINERTVSDDQIEEAAKQANIHEDIRRFPDGYETNCGNSGNIQLSGGQKQRIAIARALLRKPRILLFDEATSALDNRSEEIVQKAIDEVRQNRTCLTIAHRLTTIENSENIVVINHGQVVEQGRHEQLIEQKGMYYRMQRATQKSQ